MGIAASLLSYIWVQRADGLGWLCCAKCFGWCKMLALAISLVAPAAAAQDVRLPSLKPVPPKEGWSAAELWAWGEIRAGRIADFNDRDNRELDPTVVNGWNTGRSLGPDFLKEMLLQEHYGETIPVESVRIVGAWFPNGVNLARLQLQHQLWLTNCRFEETASLSGLRLDGLLFLDGSAFTGPLYMASLVVGQLSLRNATFEEVDLSNAKVDRLETGGEKFAVRPHTDGLQVKQSPWLWSLQIRLREFTTMIISFVVGVFVTIVVHLLFDFRARAHKLSGTGINEFELVDTRVFVKKALVPSACIVVFCLFVMALSAAEVGELSFAEASIVVLAGSVALIAVTRAVILLGEGESIEVQSQWGGLGSGLGGWRLSPVAALMLLTLVLTGTAAGIVASRQPDLTTGQQRSGNAAEAFASETFVRDGTAGVAQPNPEH